jgi:Glyoxalase-like domain
VVDSKYTRARINYGYIDKERVATLKIGSIVIDCCEFDKMLAFWEEALHYYHNEPLEEGWVILRDPNGKNPNISLNKVSERPSTRNRLHFDLYSNDREGEIERLLRIGASVHPQTYDPEDDFRVLEDPDGNLFCVVQKNSA